MTHADADGNVRVLIWCPGCGYGHTPCVEGPAKTHDWNGDLAFPTFNPSLAIPQSDTQKPDGSPAVIACHSWVKKGLITFLGDCGHELAGQTHELVADL